MSGDLVAFLRARLDEDYAAADLVLRPYGDATPLNDAAWWTSEREWHKHDLSSDETPLLTRMTPRRVLAEVDAKRRIIDLHKPTQPVEWFIGERDADGLSDICAS